MAAAPADEDLPFDATLLSRVEDAGLNASAPPQQRWLDGWLIRFSPGKAAGREDHEAYSTVEWCDRPRTRFGTAFRILLSGAR